MVLLIQLSGWVYSLKHSETTQKNIKQFYYDKTMVHFCKGCDVQKGGHKWKIMWIFELVIVWY